MAGKKKKIIASIKASQYFCVTATVFDESGRIEARHTLEDGGWPSDFSVLASHVPESCRAFLESEDCYGMDSPYKTEDHYLIEPTQSASGHLVFRIY